MKQKRKKRSLSGITGGLLCLLFLPVIILNLLLIADSYINPEALPGVLGIKPAIVLSGSMEPVIRAGDLIFIHSTETEKLREGDVICYLDSGAAVTHRIIAISTGEDGLLRYQTKGDANDAQDRISVTADQIQGTWKGGRIAMFYCSCRRQRACSFFLFCLWFFFSFGIWGSAIGRIKRRLSAERNWKPS